MRGVLAAGCVIVVAGCRVQPRIEAPPMSYSDHVARAEALEHDAAIHDQAADDAGKSPAQWICPVDPALEEEVTSAAGEKLVKRSACHEVKAEDRDRHRRAARRLRALARAHLAGARALVDSEHAACAPLSDAERARTPFFDHAAIAAVARTPDGARVTFRDAGDLSRVIACHRARSATMGHDPAYMPYDPTVLADIGVQIDGPVVSIHAVTPAALAAVWSRADALTR